MIPKINLFVTDINVHRLFRPNAALNLKNSMGSTKTKKYILGRYFAVKFLVRNYTDDLTNRNTIEGKSYGFKICY